MVLIHTRTAGCFVSHVTVILISIINHLNHKSVISSINYYHWLLPLVRKLQKKRKSKKRSLQFLLDNYNIKGTKSEISHVCVCAHGKRSLLSPQFLPDDNKIKSEIPMLLKARSQQGHKYCSDFIKNLFCFSLETALVFRHWPMTKRLFKAVVERGSQEILFVNYGRFLQQRDSSHFCQTVGL